MAEPFPPVVLFPDFLVPRWPGSVVPSGLVGSHPDCSQTTQELVQEGYKGAMLAVERYSQDKGTCPQL